ncbi:MAG: putative phosphohistidine phosphatase, SixA [Bryobacterales bacterium]|nr:putative phosphohistidine phosphatase, SixA [Bryobacterales bacterium]
MEIYVLRHGEAEARETGRADRDRKLTANGKRDLKAVLKIARKAEVAPDVILTSPLVRAQETAAIAAQVLGCKRVVETRNLLPGSSPELVWKEIGSYQKTEQILVAGHEPHLGSLIGLLLEAPVMVDLKKGSLVRIATKERIGPPRGVLKWMITPKIAKAEEK